MLARYTAVHKLIVDIYHKLHVKWYLDSYFTVFPFRLFLFYLVWCSISITFAVLIKAKITFIKMSLTGKFSYGKSWATQITISVISWPTTDNNRSWSIERVFNGLKNKTQKIYFIYIHILYIINCSSNYFKIQNSWWFK